MSTRRNRTKAKGRATSASFIQIPHFVLDSPEFAQMTGAELRMFFELARQFKGSNNGDMAATRDQLESRGWSSHETVQRALKGLERKGWSVKTRQGGKHLGCTLWGLTIWPIDECGGKLSYPAEYKASHLWKEKNSGPIIGQRRPDYRALTRVAA